MRIPLCSPPRKMLNKLKTAMKVLWSLLKGAWYVLVITTPLLGFWLASSLTAYLNGPVWLAAIVGVLAFPALPLLWQWRSGRRGSGESESETLTTDALGEPDSADDDEPWLTWTDQFILRTLVINLSLLTLLVGAFPQSSFAALSTRGDWMLRGQDAAWVEPSRSVLFGAAGGLEWLYNFSRDNPYERPQRHDDSTEPPAPTAGNVEQATDRPPDPRTGGDDDERQKEPSRRHERAPDETPRWPMSDHLHPVVAEMPETAEASPSTVAEYIASREPDPHLRVKALYDWLADHISYDAEAYAAGEYPPQDAQTVFRTRKAVCAGYARLFETMAASIGIDSVYVTGVSRDRGGTVGGEGHAWNAVEINDGWFLLDATWGAGYVENDTFVKRYNPDYLLTPPHILGIDHFPDDEKWQLRDEPISRGEFMRQPMLRAGFFERGFELITPRRSQITVDDRVELQLRGRPDQHLLATLQGKRSGESERCDITGEADLSVTCHVSRRGTYDLSLFANDQPTGEFEYVGQVGVNAR